MNTLAIWANVYRQYWRINFFTALEYRANFLVWFAFTFIYHGTALAALWIVLREFPVMNGWSFAEMAFLYSLWMLAHALNNTLFLTVGDVPEHVREGEIDRLLIRPLNPLFQVLTTAATDLSRRADPRDFALHHGDDLGQPGYRRLVRDLRTLGGHRRRTHRFLDQLDHRNLRVLVRQSRRPSLDRVPARTGVHALPDLHLHQRRAARPHVLAAVRVHELFPGDVLLDKTEDALHFAPQVGLLSPLVGVACFFVAYSFWRVGLDHYEGVGH